MIEYQFSLNQSLKEDILEHLLECDKEFIPHLSSRVNLSEYALKLSLKAERFEVWKNGQLVALVAVYANNLADKTAFITNVSVAPGHTGKGLASKLLQISFEELKSKAFQRILLEVSPHNDKAMKLYRKMGFSFIEKKDENNHIFVYHLT